MKSPAEAGNRFGHLSKTTKTQEISHKFEEKMLTKAKRSAKMKLPNARLRVQMHNSNAHESGTKKRRRNFMKKALSPATSSGGGSKLHNLVVYLRQHWQLYVIFMLPAFLLTVSCPEISLRRTF